MYNFNETKKLMLEKYNILRARTTFPSILGWVFYLCYIITSRSDNGLFALKVT